MYENGCYVRYRVFDTTAIKFFPNIQSCQKWINEMISAMLCHEFVVITIYEF